MIQKPNTALVNKYLSTVEDLESVSLATVDAALNLGGYERVKYKLLIEHTSLSDLVDRERRRRIVFAMESAQSLTINDVQEICDFIDPQKARRWLMLTFKTHIPRETNVAKTLHFRNCLG